MATGSPNSSCPQRNFLRAVVLVSDGQEKPTWSFNVRDQINGATSSSRILGPPSCRSRAGGLPCCISSMGTARRSPWRGGTPMAWRQAAHHGASGDRVFPAWYRWRWADARPTPSGFIGNNAVAWKQFSGDVWDMTELDGYETPVRDGWLHDVTSGDLDSDGRKGPRVSGDRPELRRSRPVRSAAQAGAGQPLAGL